MDMAHVALWDGFCLEWQLGELHGRHTRAPRTSQDAVPRGEQRPEGVPKIGGEGFKASSPVLEVWEGQGPGTWRLWRRGSARTAAGTGVHVGETSEVTLELRAWPEARCQPAPAVCPAGEHGHRDPGVQQARVQRRHHRQEAEGAGRVGRGRRAPAHWGRESQSHHPEPRRWRCPPLSLALRAGPSSGRPRRRREGCVGHSCSASPRASVSPSGGDRGPLGSPGIGKLLTEAPAGLWVVGGTPHQACCVALGQGLACLCSLVLVAFITGRVGHRGPRSFRGHPAPWCPGWGRCCCWPPGAAGHAEVGWSPPCPVRPSPPSACCPVCAATGVCVGPPLSPPLCASLAWCLSFSLSLSLSSWLLLFASVDRSGRVSPGVPSGFWPLVLAGSHQAGWELLSLSRVPVTGPWLPVGMKVAAGSRWAQPTLQDGRSHSRGAPGCIARAWLSQNG